MSSNNGLNHNFFVDQSLYRAAALECHYGAHYHPIFRKRGIHLPIPYTTLNVLESLRVDGLN